MHFATKFPAHYFKAIKTITVILGFSLITLGLFAGSCATSKLVSSKNQVTNIHEIVLTAEAAPEGIRLNFSNISKIPSEIDTLVISFDEWAGSEDPDLESNEPIAIMNIISNRRVSQTWRSGMEAGIDVLKQVKQTGTIIFPFVQSGHKYTVTAIFVNDKLPIPENIVRFIKAECVADGGIYLVSSTEGSPLDKNIALNFNDDHTGVSLSGRPVFTNNIQYEKLQFSIVMHKGDYTESIGTYTDDLFWNFEPQFSEHLKEAGVAAGDYPAILGANVHIIYNNISWLLDIACTPVFTYSLYNGF